jgi:hypothetical protein
MKKKNVSHSVQHVVPRDKRGCKTVGGPVSAPFPAKAPLIELRKTLRDAQSQSLGVARYYQNNASNDDMAFVRIFNRLGRTIAEVESMLTEGALAGNKEIQRP